MSVYLIYLCALCLQRPEEGVDSLELELQMGVSCHVAVRTKAESSAEAASAGPSLRSSTHHSHLSELEIVSLYYNEESPTILLSAKNK